jgi:protein-export membrane protein SecD
VLQVSLWTRLLTLIILVGGILIALPNALSPEVRAKMPTFLPSSAVNLGLDLQGGSYLLLGVDFDQVMKDRVESLLGDVRASMRKARISLTDVKQTTDSLSLRITDAGELEQARSLLQSANPSMTSSVLSVGGKAYDMTESAGGVFTLRMTDAFKTTTRQQVMDQSIEVVRRRIDAMGTKEPTIERSGEDRILVQVPGLQDPGQLKTMLGKTAKMTFRLVDEQADPNASVAPIGDEILPLVDRKSPNMPASKIVVQRRVMVSGDRLTDASQGFDSQTGQPVVNFRFDNVGARQFGDVTKEHVDHLFAIVLDNEVISAPRIISPILGGSGQITGSGTAKEANDLAILLRAGA